MGVIATGCQAAHPAAVHARACRGVGGRVPGRASGQRAPQDGLDARRRRATAAHGDSRRCSVADAGTRMRCATSCGSTWSSIWARRSGAAEHDVSQSGLWTRGLLIRRTIGDGELAHFTTWCPTAPPSRPWSGSRARAGASRRASGPPRPSSASTTTRPGPGTDGTAMCPRSCSPMP